MEANPYSTSDRITTIRSKKWTAGLMAMLLCLALILAACGGDGGADTTGDTTTDGAAAVTPAADDEAVATPEEEVEAEETEVVESETGIITETEVLTETEVTTDVGVTEVTTETVVTTGTVGEGDTEETEVITETEVMTEAEEVTDAEGMTETEGVTGTGGTTQTGAAGTGEAATAGDQGVPMGVTGVEDQYVFASALLDYSFENMDGEVSGDLEDLLIDLETGRVLFASIEYGGVLDLGDKDIVVPLNAFAIGPDGELVLNIPEQQLESYPDLGNNWPNLEDPTWDDEVINFWNQAGIAQPPGFEEATTSVAWVSDLIGHGIADAAEGVGAGTVQDILINLGTAQAPYLVVEYGDAVDDLPVVIPLTALDTTNWQEGFVFGPDWTPDMFENAPRYDESLYPRDSQLHPAFGEEVESTWGDMGFDNDGDNE